MIFLKKKMSLDSKQRSMLRYSSGIEVRGRTPLERAFPILSPRYPCLLKPTSLEKIKHYGHH